jgi:hypothetical protein
MINGVVCCSTIGHWPTAVGETGELQFGPVSFPWVLCPR